MNAIKEAEAIQYLTTETECLTTFNRLRGETKMINLKALKAELLLDMAYSLHQLPEHQRLERFKFIADSNDTEVLVAIAGRIRLLPETERTEAFWILANKNNLDVSRRLVHALLNVPTDEKEQN